jgi:hypothetical protein
LCFDLLLRFSGSSNAPQSAEIINVIVTFPDDEVKPGFGPLSCVLGAEIEAKRANLPRGALPGAGLSGTLRG